MMKRILTGLMLSAAVFAQPYTAHGQDDEGFQAPDADWRDVDPENLVLLYTDYGLIGVELYPEIAPNHAERIRALARSEFYDNVPFHRVIEGFMNQTGDGANGNGTGDSDLPNLSPEFTFRRSEAMNVAIVGTRVVDDKRIDVGFYKGLPVATKPISQAFLTKDSKVDAYGLHCKGVTSMARTNDPTSANAQFFLMRAKYESLDRQYSIWGNTVIGYKYVERPRVGDVSSNPDFVPDKMNKVRIASDLPEGERPKVKILRTDSPSFAEFLETQKKFSGKLPDICKIVIPTRVVDAESLVTDDKE
ncbi:MAG: peptidylprolyl isomerase [Litorimonas sp.]